MAKLIERAAFYARDRTAFASKAIEKSVSRRDTFRGGYEDDGRITLLTVDFRNLTDHAIRLAESFRRNVEPEGRVIAVQNGDRANNQRLKAHGIEPHGFGLNIRHARALDWGMRFVKTQYVLVCDPDSFILNPGFRDEMMGRVQRHGVAGIVVTDEPKHQYYHPICTALETRLWKEGGWSWLDDLERPEVPNDVGWELTRHLGGLNPEAVMFPSRLGLAGHVFCESFTCTWGASRIHDVPETEQIDGRSRVATLDYQHRWTDWVERVAAGTDDVDGFPL